MGAAVVNQQMHVPCSACAAPGLFQKLIPCRCVPLQRHHGSREEHRCGLRGHSGSQLEGLSVGSCSGTRPRSAVGKEKCLGTLTPRIPTTTTSDVCRDRRRARHLWHAAHGPHLRASLLCSESQRLMAANSVFEAASSTACCVASGGHVQDI